MPTLTSMKSFHGKAQSLAINEIIMGDYQFFFKDIERYSKVSAQHIRSVAQKYLNPWQETLIHITTSISYKKSRGSRKRK